MKFWNLITKYQIPTLLQRDTFTYTEALHAAHDIGFPVAVKVISPQISHKSDVGGVVLNIKNEDELWDILFRMTTHLKHEIPEANIAGYTIQKMAPPNGIELIIGAKKDPQFGHTIMFGLGGIYTEILKDVSFRITPFDTNEALNMINEIKSIAILNGARGKSPINKSHIVKIIMKIQEILQDNPEIQEFDINPLIVYPNEIYAIDGRAF